jgi:hypothetical protein
MTPSRRKTRWPNFRETETGKQRPDESIVRPLFLHGQRGDMDARDKAVPTEILKWE